MTAILSNNWFVGICSSIMASIVVAVLSRFFLGKKRKEGFYSVYCLFLGVLCLFDFVSLTFINNIISTYTGKFDPIGLFNILKIAFGIIYIMSILALLCITITVIMKDIIESNMNYMNQASKSLHKNIDKIADIASQITEKTEKDV